MTRAFAIVLVLLAGACTTAPPPDPDAPRLLITVAEPVAARYQGSPARFGYAAPYGASAYVARVLDALSREYALQRVEGWRIDALGVYCEVFATRAADPDALMSALAADERVESVQRMNAFRTLASAGADPYRPLQNGLSVSDVTAAHRLTTGKGVRVAVIDTWIDAGHPDLRGRVRAQVSLTPEHARRGDHGTAVAGVIAALAGNGEGIAGVAPQADLYALAACWQEAAPHAVCTSFTLARALDLALAQRAQVINLSLAGPRDALLERLVARALARGVVVVGAVDPDAANRFPAAVDGVIGVAARGGTGATVAAPGMDVLTTLPGARYDFVSGHSIAAAHVSGIAALALQSRPALAPHDLAAALRAQDGRPLSACATLSRLHPGRPCRAAAAGETLRTPPSR